MHDTSWVHSTSHCNALIFSIIPQKQTKKIKLDQCDNALHQAAAPYIAQACVNLLSCDTAYHLTKHYMNSVRLLYADLLEVCHLDRDLEVPEVAQHISLHRKGTCS